MDTPYSKSLSEVTEARALVRGLADRAKEISETLGECIFCGAIPAGLHNEGCVMDATQDAMDRWDGKEVVNQRLEELRLTEDDIAYRGGGKNV